LGNTISQRFEFVSGVIDAGLMYLPIQKISLETVLVMVFANLKILNIQISRFLDFIFPFLLQTGIVVNPSL